MWRARRVHSRARGAELTRATESWTFRQEAGFHVRRGAISHRHLISALLLLGTVVLTVLAVKNAQQKAGADFVVIHRAAVAAVHGGDIYAAPAEEPARRYRYSPGTAFLLAPFAALDLPEAKRAVRWVIAAALLGVVAWLSLRRGASARPWAVPLAFLLGVRWWIDELHLGQVNLFALLAVLLAFTLEDRGRRTWAGALMALPIAFKVAPIILAIDWALRRRWRQLLGVCAGGLAMVALPALWVGAGDTIRLHLRWVLTVSDSSRTMIAAIGNQSLWAMAHFVGAPSWAAALASIALVAFALRPADTNARRALLLAATPLVSSWGWIQNFVFMIPLLAWVFQTGSGRQIIALLVFACVSPLVQYEVVGPALEHWLIRREVIGLAGLGIFGVGAWVAASQQSAVPGAGAAAP